MKLDKNKKKNLILSVVFIIVCLLLCIFLDAFKSDFYYVISILESVLVYSVVVLSMNIVVGFTGLFSLGQAGFMAIGAYVTGILTIPVQYRSSVYYATGISDALANISLPMPIALILGGLVAAGFAALIGIPVLRLKSDYLAIATLGFAEIIRAVIASPMMNSITNGSFGLNRIPGYKGILECFIYASICIIIMILLINSSIGRDFKAIREDEIAARSVGINLFKTKQLSFVVSSFFTGVGGGLLAMYMRSIDSKTFSITLTYEILLMVVLGGIGSISGSIVGSLLVNVGKEILRFFDEPLSIFDVNIPFFRPGLRMVIFSVLLMVVVLFFRKGIMGGKELNADFFSSLFKSKKRKEA